MSETTQIQAPLARRARPAALGFIYTAIAMNTISMGVIIPVFPTLVKSLTGQATPARRRSWASSAPPGR